MSKHDLDFNSAPTQSELIPDGTMAPVVLSLIYGDAGEDNELHSSKVSQALMLSLEATVTEGQYARRKFWPRYYMGAASGAMSEGQETAVGVSRKVIRAIVEAARGIGPTDETPAAIKARRLNGYRDLSGMEFWCVVGVEKGRDGYDDKNVIKRVLHRAPEPGAKAEAASMRAAPARPQEKSKEW